MRTLFFFIQKELLQVFRNKAMLPLMFVMPIIQLLILSHVATNEVKELRLSLRDMDHSTLSTRLVNKMTASGYFLFEPAKEGLPDPARLQGEREIRRSLDADQTDLILSIPEDFEQNLRLGRPTELQLLVNAINSMKAGVATTYAS
ncbi:MAG TPA: ABC transporter permease, partial [Phaeodactylibacter sp.]|nr:ABC transporter permease [Phaeodactylibacter sp.]